jgi:uncharacterized protein (TIGR00730 family)
MEVNHLKQKLLQLLDSLPDHEHGKWIELALTALLRVAASESDRLDWKIFSGTLTDLERAFNIFHPYRHVRKVTIFGSARISSDRPEYQLAADFARRITELGFMVLTGAGGGIMQAGNEGAGRDRSFGLNIKLPFEQQTNEFIAADPKLISFRYFFTRKLFFLRESDAIALFPGGFGTQDEAFETLTLCQTGKYGPAPLVLIDLPGGDYWQEWDNNLYRHLVRRALINPEDRKLYTITDNLSVACNTITNFYRVYHSSRYVGRLFVMRLNLELSDETVETLNQDFSDLLLEGRIEKSKAFPEEIGDETEKLPRLVFYLNQKAQGRLYELINKINQLVVFFQEEHPERK